MSRNSRIRLIGLLATLILTVAVITRKKQPDVEPQRSNGPYLLLRHRPSDQPHTMAPLLSIPMQTNESDAAPTPTLRIPVIQATPKRANSDPLPPYWHTSPASDGVKR